MPKPSTEEDKKEPDIEIDEKSLEDLAEEPEGLKEEEFSEAMLRTSSESTTPTLQSTPETKPEEQEDTLEEIGKTAPATGIPEETTPDRDYMMVYNEPDYSSGAPEETVMKEASERQMVGRTAEQLRHVQPRAIMEDWHETPDTMRTGGGGMRDYAVSADVKVLEKPGDTLPFEQSGLKDYRPLKRGKK